MEGFGVVKESGWAEEKVDSGLEDVERSWIRNSPEGANCDVTTELGPEGVGNPSGETNTEGVRRREGNGFKKKG